MKKPSKCGLCVVMILAAVVIFVSCGSQGSEYLAKCENAYNALRDISCHYYVYEENFENKQEKTTQTGACWYTNDRWLSETRQDDTKYLMLSTQGQQYIKMDENDMWQLTENGLSNPPYYLLYSEWEDMGFTFVSAEKRQITLGLPVGEQKEDATAEVKSYTWTFNFDELEALESITVNIEYLVEGETLERVTTVEFRSSNEEEIVQKIDEISAQVEMEQVT